LEKEKEIKLTNTNELLESVIKGRIMPTDKEKLALLEAMIKDIFGINAEIDYQRFGYEVSQLTIKNIDYDEDLLTIFNRLRNTFWVDIDADTQIDEIEWEGKKERNCYGILNVELIAKDKMLEISADIRIRKVNILQGKAKEEAEKKGLKPDDLVIVTTTIVNSLPEYHIKKIEGDPVSYLLKYIEKKKNRF